MLSEQDLAVRRAVREKLETALEEIQQEFPPRIKERASDIVLQAIEDLRMLKESLEVQQAIDSPNRLQGLIVKVDQLSASVRNKQAKLARRVASNWYCEW